MIGVSSKVSKLNILFTQIGFWEPRAKLEPKWHMPLWSSISNTAHVSTCVSTLTKFVRPVLGRARATCLPERDTDLDLGFMFRVWALGLGFRFRVYAGSSKVLGLGFRK